MIFTSVSGRGRPRVSSRSAVASPGAVSVMTGEASVWAKTMHIGAPNAASTRLTSAGGTTAPPVNSRRTDDTSVAASPG